MPTEVEIKLKVDTHDAVRAKLREQNAQPSGKILEINHIFDNAERTMLSTDRGLRVRECRDEPGQLVKATLTYKGPRAPGRIKCREEIELAIDDPAAGANLLGQLGFREAVRFEKRRESWRLGECLVELDEVPCLGTFVEIEGPDENRIEAVRAALGLADTPLVRGSYIGLLVRYCQSQSLPFASISF